MKAARTVPTPGERPRQVAVYRRRDAADIAIICVRRDDGVPPQRFNIESEAFNEENIAGSIDYDSRGYRDLGIKHHHAALYSQAMEQSF